MKKFFIPLLMTTKLYAACAEVEVIDYFNESVLRPTMSAVSEPKDSLEAIFQGEKFFHFFEGSALTESGESTIYELLMSQLKKAKNKARGMELAKLRLLENIHTLTYDAYFSLKACDDSKFCELYNHLRELSPEWEELQS